MMDYLASLAHAERLKGAGAVSAEAADPVVLREGPYFEELVVGARYKGRGTVALGESHNMAFTMLTGDENWVALRSDLSRRMAEGRQLANPLLVLNISIGQSTSVTQRVIANLFYEQVRLRRMINIGEVLSSTVRVEALCDSRFRTGRAPRGKALLRVDTLAGDELVLSYRRCALLPCRADAPPGRADVIDAPSREVGLEKFAGSISRDWNFDACPSGGNWVEGAVVRDSLRETADIGGGLVRLTGNAAHVHRSPSAHHGGRRLVYGGETMAFAAASLSRVDLGYAGVIGWQYCDHLAPVFDGDVLSFTHEYIQGHPIGDAGAEVAAIRSVVSVVESKGRGRVLEWCPIVFRIGTERS